MTSLADINSQIKKHDEQIAQLRKQAEELRSKERSAVIEEVRQKIADYGLSAVDLKLSVRSGTTKRSVAASAGPKGAAKYRGPNGESWSGGRGRKPRWVAEVLASGKSLSDFEV
ncbi:MAG: H-NS histone family protein [Hyphomicrobiales bacterium]|nr:MAG: H-NS histone family protein [Hyphomicrobiales bacterium]